MLQGDTIFEIKLPRNVLGQGSIAFLKQKNISYNLKKDRRSLPHLRQMNVLVSIMISLLALLLNPGGVLVCGSHAPNPVVVECHSEKWAVLRSLKTVP